MRFELIALFIWTGWFYFSFQTNCQLVVFINSAIGPRNIPRSFPLRFMNIHAVFLLKKTEFPTITIKMDRIYIFYHFVFLASCIPSPDIDDDGALHLVSVLLVSTNFPWKTVASSWWEEDTDRTILITQSVERIKVIEFIWKSQKLRIWDSSLQCSLQL